ncbi:hypothetical protein CG723_43650 [Streptomyces sp. CB01635]|nr:hypothetical protein CG723_43650 [Streptomyces sp. CB01635]
MVPSAGTARAKGCPIHPAAAGASVGLAACEGSSTKTGITPAFLPPPHIFPMTLHQRLSRQIRHAVGDQQFGGEVEFLRPQAASCRATLERAPAAAAG